MRLLPWRSKQRSNGDSGHPEITSMTRFREEMDNVFDRFFRDPWGAGDSPLGRLSGWDPQVEVSENDKEVTVRAEVPGVDPKNIEITVSGDVLTFAGEKKEETEHKDDTVYASERSYGSFRRSMRLPHSVDPENVTAEHANGVLTIRLTKKDTAAMKRVPVKASK